LSGDRSTQDDDAGMLPVFSIRRALKEEGDANLVRRDIAGAKQGDPEALHRLYERYADNVFSYVRTILHDEHEAEDVTQHVFTKLLTRIASYEERSVPFSAWLLRIARNCAIDHVRSRRAVCVEEVPCVDGPAFDAVAADRRHAVEDALGSLTDGQREVVVLRHVMGFSAREIASQMGKSEGAVHTLHCRARRALRSEFLRREIAPVTPRRGVTPRKRAVPVTA
jgi:RNA polymerase sigma-70 factor (ECF subfamily)